EVVYWPLCPTDPRSSASLASHRGRRDRRSGEKIMAVTSPGAAALYIILGFAGAGFARPSQPSRQTDTSNPEFRCFRGGVPYFPLYPRPCVLNRWGAASGTIL